MTTRQKHCKVVVAQNDVHLCKWPASTEVVIKPEGVMQAFRGHKHISDTVHQVYKTPLES